MVPAQTDSRRRGRASEVLRPAGSHPSRRRGDARHVTPPQDRRRPPALTHTHTHTHTLTHTHAHAHALTHTLTSHLSPTPTPSPSPSPSPLPSPTPTPSHVAAQYLRRPVRAQGSLARGCMHAHTHAYIRAPGTLRLKTSDGLYELKAASPEDGLQWLAHLASSAPVTALCEEAKPLRSADLAAEIVRKFAEQKSPRRSFLGQCAQAMHARLRMHATCAYGTRVCMHEHTPRRVPLGVVLTAWPEATCISQHAHSPYPR